MVVNGMEWAKSRKRRFRRFASAVRILVLVLTASSTVILGLQDLNGWEGIAFSMVAVSTAISALEPFFNWRSRWVLMEDAQYRLNRILDRINYYLMKHPADLITPAEIDKFFEQNELVWRLTSNRWIEHRRADRGERPTTS